MTLPESLSINAWTGDEVASADALAEGGRNWALHERGRQRLMLAAESPPDLRDFRDERVGWGLLLPENPALTPAEQATAADAPEPIQKLLLSRPGSPVLRYAPDLAPEALRRYRADGGHADIPLTGTKRGTGPGRLPLYLLICADPSDVPWAMQYVLNQGFYVGRLRPSMEGLDRYVDALIDGWAGAESRPTHPVVWATDQDAISHLMRVSIAEKTAERLHHDSDVQQTTTLFDQAATGPALIEALAQERPGLVVTTSHGMTGPTHDPDAMRAQLGVPVDDGHHVLQVDALLDAWQPDGAIWYAHACCSAGGDTGTIYHGLLPQGSAALRVVDGVAALGAQVAPLPERLLGAEKPLRSFVGHVEPTFDWTLQQPESKQLMTDGTVRALYEGLYQARPETIGMAFDVCHRAAGDLFGQLAQLRDHSPLGDPNTRPRALRLQLTALDRQSLVILGDPTVAPVSVAP
ncbi:MAG: hypothetical protein NXI30_12685 [bacterium]|nr:hypothetical protein [bacterium]